MKVGKMLHVNRIGGSSAAVLHQAPERMRDDLSVLHDDDVRSRNPRIPVSPNPVKAKFFMSHPLAQTVKMRFRYRIVN